MEVRSATVPAYAKLNLSLLVLDKRSDGYHELRTVFQTVSLADRLKIELEPAARGIEIEVASSVAIADNLVARAARAVMEAGRIRGRVRFRLEKRIPMGAGLGGGSSDAAAVLLALPVLARRGVQRDRLLELAAGLGSDVPFFLMGGTALGLGRGEELYPLPALRERHVLLAVPPVHVSTPDAYRALGRRAAPAPGLTQGAHAPKIERFQQLAWSLECPGARQGWKALPENDFEAAVFPRHPAIRNLLELLRRQGAEPARMSGSGSALFGVFESRQKLERAARAVQAACPEGVVESIRCVTRDQYRAAWRRALAVHLISPTSPLAWW